MLNWMVVRYKVKADRAAENEQYIKAVFEQLHAEHPAGITYASFKADDGVSFMHVVGVDSELGSNPLTQLPAFKQFVATVQDRCEEMPVSTPLAPVGVYKWEAAHAASR